MNIYWHPWFGPVYSTFGCLEVSFADNSYLVWQGASKAPAPLMKVIKGFVHATSLSTFIKETKMKVFVGFVLLAGVQSLQCHHEQGIDTLYMFNMYLECHQDIFWKVILPVLPRGGQERRCWWENLETASSSRPTRPPKMELTSTAWSPTRYRKLAQIRGSIAIGSFWDQETYWEWPQWTRKGGWDSKKRKDF